MTIPDSSNLYTFLSLGQIFSRTFAICFDRLDIYLTISGLVHLPAIVLMVLVVVALAPVTKDAATDHISFMQEHMASVFTIVYLQALISMMATIAGEGGMVRATADIYVGRSPEWYPSLRFGLQKFLPLIGASLVVFLAWAGICGVTLVLASIFLAGAGTKIGLLLVLIGVVIVAIGVVASVYMFVTVIPLYPIIVIEEKGPINALRRCMELSRGRRGYFFVGVFLLYVGQVILGRVLHGIFNDGGDPASFFFDPSGAIVSFIPNILYVPLVTIIKTVLYVSVRVDKEGLNQQVLQRELSEPIEYNPPVSDYRQVSLVDDRQQPNIVSTLSDDDGFA
mmetsp:Transcript_17720/g.33607  ORF Transcript_17720/g.33607 Transcript_17720/m.33607 type:complete len:337 (+) Transcript_17720:96-1106(+)